MLYLTIAVKPRSKRTAKVKGTYYSEAQSKPPRNDSRGMAHGGCSCSHYPPRPYPEKDADIEEWLTFLAEPDFPVNYRRRRGGSSHPVFFFDGVSGLRLQAGGPHAGCRAVGRVRRDRAARLPSR